MFEMTLIDRAKDPNGKTIHFRFKESLKQHHCSITFINSTTDLVKDLNSKFVKVHRLSISDALGNISIWHKDSNRLKFIVQFAGFNK